MLDGWMDDGHRFAASTQNTRVSNSPKQIEKKRKKNWKQISNILMINKWTRHIDLATT